MYQNPIYHLCISTKYQSTLYLCKTYEYLTNLKTNITTMKLIYFSVPFFNTPLIFICTIFYIFI